MRAPSDAGSAKAGVATARFTRPLVAVTVVLLSAATGYAASRLWPLPTSSGLVMNLETTGNASSAPGSQAGPQFNYRAPAQGSRAPTPAASVGPSASPSLSAVAARPREAPQADSSISPHNPPPPVPAAATPLAEPAKTAARDSTRAPDSPDAALAQTPQAGDAVSAPTANPDTRRSRRTAAARRRTAGARTSRVVRSQKAGEPAVAEFAPNPRPNQPLRDFMASRSARN
jgi:hypothetical protein